MIELAYSGSKLLVLLTLQEKLRDLLAATFVGNFNRSLIFALRVRYRCSTLVLVLLVNWAESIFGPPLLVFQLLLLSSLFPDLFLFRRQSVPAVA